jgi:deoxyribodipyrimidine photo-lyase
MATQLVWYKRDLRVRDHAPLTLAAKAGPCLCVYIYEPELIEAEDFDAAHLRFVSESLAELRKSLQRLGGVLLVRVGEAVDVLERMLREFSVAKVWAHEETFNNVSYQRDRRVRAWAKDRGVAFQEIPQTGVVRRLANRDGWAKIWQERVSQPLSVPPERIKIPSSLKDTEMGEILGPDRFCVQSFRRKLMQIGGEQNASECLDSFLSERGVNYRSDMSSPLLGESGCSRLSAHIAYGNISVRTIHQQTVIRMRDLKALKQDGVAIDASWLKSLSSFQSRLNWHCHFMQKMEDEPSIEFRNFNRAYDGLRENEFNTDYFQAWCDGKTGYPMVDACMRALHETGWINFRMRAMVVSFAAYHLWLHWREPALYLARLFLDYEPGIHYSQIQMQSGVTGINTVRIYSPAKQVADQDPQGLFIRRYVPELADVPDRYLAEPHRMTAMEEMFYNCKIGKDYPAPIVDHKTRYSLARDRIHAVKRQAATQAESAKVFQKHGSRKIPMKRR